MEKNNLPPVISAALDTLLDKMQGVAKDSAQRVDILLGGLRRIQERLGSDLPLTKEDISNIVINTLDTLSAHIKSKP